MKKGNIWIFAGLLLIAAALSIAGYNLWDAERAGDAGEKMLAVLAPQIASDPPPAHGRPVNIAAAPEDGETAAAEYAEIEYPDYVLNPTMEMPVQVVDGVACIGVLRIPALDRELPVCGSWDYSKLRTAPCRYTGSAYLDNMTICAHNYNRHFGQLKNLSLGDLVTFTDTDGNEFRYHVAEIETLQPTAIEEMTESEWDLSLFTCTVGGRTRVTVRCSREADTELKR